MDINYLQNNGMSDAFADRIRERLGHGDVRVAFYDSIDSTNNEAKRLLMSGCGESTLIVARSQTAGRGRRGRSFFSPADTGLYMSLCLPIGGARADVVSVTTAAAVAVCRTVERASGNKAQIKWVNDILIESKKVCGILAETVTQPCGQLIGVVIGIGVNVGTAFPDELKDIAGNIGAQGVDFAGLAAEIADSLLDIIFTPAHEYMDYYRSRSAVLGKSVRFTANGGELEGIAQSIDDKGRLCVVLPDGGVRLLDSGEVTLRITGNKM